MSVQIYIEGVDAEDVRRQIQSLIATAEAPKGAVPFSPPAIGAELQGGTWWSFTDEQIARMDSSALAWWQKWKPVLHTIVTMSPAVPGGEKPAEQQEAA